MPLRDAHAKALFQFMMLLSSSSPQHCSSAACAMRCLKVRRQIQRRPRELAHFVRPEQHDVERYVYASSRKVQIARAPLQRNDTESDLVGALNAVRPQRMIRVLVHEELRDFNTDFLDDNRQMSPDRMYSSFHQRSASSGTATRAPRGFAVAESTSVQHHHVHSRGVRHLRVHDRASLPRVQLDWPILTR